VECRARKRPGDFLDLRAETDLALVLSNCPHPLDPARSGRRGPRSCWCAIVRHLPRRRSLPHGLP